MSKQPSRLKYQRQARHKLLGGYDTGTSDDNTDNEPDPSYRCVYCGTGTNISNEHKQRAPHFCEECAEVTSHEKLS